MDVASLDAQWIMNKAITMFMNSMRPVSVEVLASGNEVIFKESKHLLLNKKSPASFVDVQHSN